MKRLLQRRPLGVPLHESATVIAFAFLVTSLILDLLAWAGAARDTTGTNVGAYAILFAALIATVLAVLAALAETLDLEEELRRYSWGYTGLLAVVIVLEIADLFLRQGSLQDQVVPPDCALEFRLVDNDAAGRALSTRVFAPGATQRWDHLIEQATGSALTPAVLARELVS